ncbi:MAG: M14 family murein peptide amidase A [Thermodesulfobacteriota bacterium]
MSPAGDKLTFFQKLGRATCICSLLFLCLGSGLILYSAPSLAETCQEEVGREDMCRLISNKLASIGLQECRELRLEPSGHCSEEGKPLLIKEYPPLYPRIPQARVLVVGGTHGDEYSSISVLFKWMDILKAHHSGLFHWKFVPLLNPDGLLKPQSSRTNANGVDLNRNFPAPLWGKAGYQRWVEKTGKDPRYYPGQKPLSQAESIFLVELIQDFQPQAVISLHSPLGLVDYDGPGRPPNNLGELQFQRLGNFAGTLGNFAGKQGQIPVLTLELASSGSMPSQKQISETWMDLIRWLVINLPVTPAWEQIQAQKQGQGQSGTRVQALEGK